MPTKKNRLRPIERLAKEHYSWWSQSFIFIKKTEIKAWQAIFVIAFIAGICFTLVWTVSLGIHSTSSAAPAIANVIAPNGGEIFNVGSAAKVSWATQGVEANYVKIDWYQDRDGDNVYETSSALFGGQPQPRNGSVSWIIPDKIINFNSVSTKNKIKITVYSETGKILDVDYSNTPFMVLPINSMR